MTTRLFSALSVAAAFGSAAFVSLSAADFDRPAAATDNPLPPYAFDLRKTGTEGAVLLSFTITAKGDVTGATVVSSTDRVFEEPTLLAAKKWKFTPAIRQGRAISVRAIQLVTFQSSERKPATPARALVEKLKPRRATGAFLTDSPCYCESGKAYRDCHGALFARLPATSGATDHLTVVRD